MSETEAEASRRQFDLVLEAADALARAMGLYRDGRADAVVLSGVLSCARAQRAARHATASTETVNV